MDTSEKLMKAIEEASIETKDVFILLRGIQAIGKGRVIIHIDNGVNSIQIIEDINVRKK